MPVDVPTDPDKGDGVTAIIVVTFDRRHLPKLWENLASQTYRPFEAIVVDNDCHDGSVEFVREHKLPFPTEIIHRDTNAGVTPAWNTALKAVRTPWVLLLSPDCLFPPELTEKLVERARLKQAKLPAGKYIGGVSPSIMWKGRMSQANDDSPYFSPKKECLGYANTAEGEVMSYWGACALMSTAFLRRLGGWDECVNFGGDEMDMGLQGQLLGYRFFWMGKDLTVVHPMEPWRSGMKGTLLRMRTNSIWFSLFKHGGITIDWSTVVYETIVVHLFWHRFITSPRLLLSQLKWLVRSSGSIREHRRALRNIWSQRVPR
jgi:GT2 family glycosyltransferase